MDFRIPQQRVASKGKNMWKFNSMHQSPSGAMMVCNRKSVTRTMV